MVVARQQDHHVPFLAVFLTNATEVTILHRDRLTVALHTKVIGCAHEEVASAASPQQLRKVHACQNTPKPFVCRGGLVKVFTQPPMASLFF